ncbi:DUF397 domain-containing protein [Streptomyces huiliensis]|uniref:DUF397 domain-containing protein n=1 Tax=Streptomyces huiliensis TaxID=2876027 RepID=UPI003556301B
MNNCVEAAALPAGPLAVRDSKRPAGPCLLVGPAAWTAFVTRLRATADDVRRGPRLRCSTR